MSLDGDVRAIIMADPEPTPADPAILALQSKVDAMQARADKLEAALARSFDPYCLDPELLGCVCDVFGDDVVTANTAIINNAMGTGKYSWMRLPPKALGINDTLRRGDAGISCPNNFAIIGSGGWANGYLPATNEVNNCASCLVWCGPPDRPMIRFGGYGNFVNRVNLFGYKYVSGAVAPTVRGDCGIEIRRLKVGPAAGKSTLGITATGLNAAIRTYAPDNDLHCDNTHVTDLSCRDCLSAFHSTCSQSVTFQFDFVKWWSPIGIQGTIFDFAEGGKFHCSKLGVSGDHGCTIIKTATHFGPGVGDYLFDSVDVDRAVVNATKSGLGYLRLVEQRGVGERVQMRGMISYDPKELVRRATTPAARKWSRPPSRPRSDSTYWAWTP